MTAPGDATVTGVDLPALRRFVEREVPGCSGPLDVRPLFGGRSNLTYLVTDGTHRWVLRRPPLGTLTPTAHDMDREYRVMAALAGTGVPVPRTVLSCADASVIGAPFTLVSFVGGTVVRDAGQAARLPAEDARRCSEALVDQLAALHTLDPYEVGLGGFGRPAGYVERQVRRWRGQWDRVATRDLPELDALHATLVRGLSLVRDDGGEPAVLHGDFRLDNVILDAGDPGRVAAIVDWEMAALGDPLADLGLLLVYWDPVCEPVLGGGHVPAANPGFLSARELTERYAERSGRDMSALAFHRALGYFKLAVIAEGVHARHRAGRTVGPGFDRVGSAVPALLRSGLSVDLPPARTIQDEKRQGT
ncbi:phosphotransferase family protein [Streptomyces griseiscabiei]|uniref:Phosphotransferase family protein n=1 Tax=Streptomyces griseiscabiei TaxID=2993540 RepID=A0ABU4L3A4_9ACTN|nr:phosphotransferase family protein [Streptomyces griseiscabiei]MDX2910207.1 phosphotransferase family protein [Streptomyces griseiscabiei]